MSVYRFTIPVEFEVEIDTSNETVDGPPALQGDAAITAVRRALWVLFRSDVAQFNEEVARQVHAAKKPLGIKRTLVRGHERDVPVTVVPPRHT